MNTDKEKTITKKDMTDTQLKSIQLIINSIQGRTNE